MRLHHALVEHSERHRDDMADLRQEVRETRTAVVSLIGSKLDTVLDRISHSSHVVRERLESIPDAVAEITGKHDTFEMVMERNRREDAEKKRESMRATRDRLEERVWSYVRFVLYVLTAAGLGFIGRALMSK